MGNILFLHALGLNEYALRERLPDPEEVGEPKSAFEQVRAKLGLFPDVQQVVLLTDVKSEDLAAVWNDTMGRTLVRDTWSVPELLETMLEESGGYDHAFVVWADEPLVDLKLTKKMFENHLRYFADYSFADGYPKGLCPQIIKPEAIQQLLELSRRHQVSLSREYIFEVLQKDINAFDLETEIAPTDQRLLRVALSADTRRNKMLLERVIEAGGHDAPSVQDILQKRPELLRTLPAYLYAQVVDGCPQSCSYCPYPKFGGDILHRRDEISTESWQDLLRQVKAFCDDLVVGISVWGEPSLHGRIGELIDRVLEIPRFSLVIETSGVGWTLAGLESIAEKHAGNRALTWIVSLDANDGETYRQLRGANWEEAKETTDLLRKLFPHQVFVQAVRMRDNEEQVDQFFKYWQQQEGVDVIIQKYDTFCGYLPERKISDLSPVRRFPCWHLKRDLVVLMDGSVPMCREDLRQEHLLGNVYQDGIETVWRRGEEKYRLHLEEDYPEACRKCDEYYTYNF